VTELQNDTLLRALLREPVEYTPDWMMRQAGRYLAEYRETRARAGSFMDLCRNPELACEVTIQPLERFPLDAAILFSDILTVPDAMGLGLYFAEGEGPHFEHPVRSAADVERIRVPDPEDDLGYVMDAVRTIRRELAGRVPLIGFSGSPWTLATYMVEGGTTKHFALSKAMLFDRPDLMHALLGKVAEAVTLYLNAQIAAGAQVADIIVEVLEAELVLVPGVRPAEPGEAPAPRVIVELLGGVGEPRVVLGRAADALDRMAETGCDALGVDWTTELSDARRLVQDKVALQGNLDPCTLYASPERIRREVGRVLASYGAGSGHVFNLGHGIHPDTNPEHAGAMVAAVHELSRPYHAGG